MSYWTLRNPQQTSVAATLDASKLQLRQVAVDAGVHESLRLLLLAADRAHHTSLADALPGIDSGATAADVLATFQSRLRTGGAETSDFGVLAMRAAVSTLASVLERTAASGDVATPIAGFGDLRGQAKLTRVFFSRFLAQYVDYFVGRYTPLVLGGRVGFTSIGDLERFDGQVHRACAEATRSVEPASALRLAHGDISNGTSVDLVTGLIDGALREIRLSTQGRR